MLPVPAWLAVGVGTGLVLLWSTHGPGLHITLGDVTGVDPPAVAAEATTAALTGTTTLRLLGFLALLAPTTLLFASVAGYRSAFQVLAAVTAAVTGEAPWLTGWSLGSYLGGESRVLAPRSRVSPWVTAPASPAVAVAGVGYLLVYLVGLGHLGLGPSGLELSVVADPLSRAVRLRGPFQWEPVALVVAGPVELLLSPLNVVLGSLLGVLVGLNLAVSLVAYRGQSACRFGPGAAAGLPGVLSGVACCGPTILVVTGVQASTTVLTLFQWLLPLSVVALVGTLLWVGTNVEP